MGSQASFEKENSIIRESMIREVSNNKSFSKEKAKPSILEMFEKEDKQATKMDDQTRRESHQSLKTLFQDMSRPKNDMTTDMYMSILKDGGTGSAAGILLDRTTSGPAALRPPANI